MSDATAAEVANDLTAQGRFFDRRDDEVARVCWEAAAIIRAALAGQHPSPKVLEEIDRQLIRQMRRYPADSQIGKSLGRAQRKLLVIEARTSDA